jgi:hypothetical protein
MKTREALARGRLKDQLQRSFEKKLNKVFRGVENVFYLIIIFPIGYKVRNRLEETIQCINFNGNSGQLGIST